MRNQPELHELLQAVDEFLRETAAPQLTGQSAFHARVAANVLGIVQRELRAAAPADARRLAGLRALLGRDDADPDTLERELCERIARDEITLETPGLADHLWRCALDAIAVDQPGYAADDDGTPSKDPR